MCINKISTNIIDASYEIEPYSTVLPINDSDNWICGHISNYLGINKPMIILENYEVSLNHFPLTWNHKKIPLLHLGNPEEGIDILPTNTTDDESQVDYIFILSDTKLPNRNLCSHIKVESLYFPLSCIIIFQI